MDISERVILLKDSDVRWDWNSGPSLFLKGAEGWGSNEVIDPFPCYHHDRDLIIKLAAECESKFPIEFKPYYYILPFEPIGRTNGWATKDTVYGDEEPRKFAPYIGLAGKRIPIMPAMSKYIVTHEYSHCIDYWLNYKLKYKDNEQPTQFDKEYAELRKIELDTKYGARHWHTNIGEIIANDCRICVFNAEPEFWPHLCSHPLETPQVVEFWKEMQAKFAA